jgi:hypothetical protein
LSMKEKERAVVGLPAQGAKAVFLVMFDMTEALVVSGCVKWW